MIKKDDVIELLAPVGTMESLYAAVENGADAVYLGGKVFNARQYASNFGIDELREAVKYAHLRGIRVYVTVNILLENKELEEAVDYIKHLYEIDVDGLIVQDLGLVHLIKTLFPDFELHASTQMTINNLEGTLFLENMGFKRVVLARELSTKEIKYIDDNSNVELEGFIHGALCVCYSGQCLMSSIIGGRSGNRGTCAQPCRMPYSIVHLKDGKVVSEQLVKKHILSTKDLCTIENIDDVVDSGLKSLKIEGRMKRPEYVALVVSKYRKALDMGVKLITKEDKKELLQIFNRGFTKGYLFGDFGKGFISLDRPDNRGVYIGKVENIDRKNMYIELIEDLDKGDGIELTTEKGEYVGLVANISNNKGGILKLDRIRNVSIGSPVYKTSSVSLLERANSTFVGEEKIKYPLKMEVNISIGNPAYLSIYDGENVIHVETEQLVEKGQKVSLTKEKIENQLSKLSDEPYYIDVMDINLEQGSFLSLSNLNGLRRDGIEELNKKKMNFNNRIKVKEDILCRAKNDFFKYDETKVDLNEKKLSVKVSNIKQFESIDLKKLDRIYLGFYENVDDCIKEVKKANKEVYFYTDKIYTDKGLRLLGEKLELFSDYLDGISVSNIGTLNFVKNRFNLPIHGDIGLNVFNSYTARLLRENKVGSITLSPELTLKQIEDVVNRASMPYEVIGYGYLPLMVMKHCPMSLIKGCNGDSECSICKFNSGYGLKDRKNIIFPFRRQNSITTIYNSVPLVIIEDLNTLFDKGIEMIRLDFTYEDKDISMIQDAYYNRLYGNLKERDLTQVLEYFRKDAGFTKGHYFRGVL